MLRYFGLPADSHQPTAMPHGAARVGGIVPRKSHGCCNLLYVLAGGLPALQEALQHKLRTKNGLTGVSQ
jgi:hypothetical protein